jgi:hypothetical protein
MVLSQLFLKRKVLVALKAAAGTKMATKSRRNTAAKVGSLNGLIVIS